VIHKKRALLAHSTSAPWWRSYTPPKGGVEPGESLAEAASREVFEEVGILIPPAKLSNSIEVEYRNPRGHLYKVVHLFIHEIENLSDINLEEDHVPFSQLQREEVDEARFMDLEEVKKKILPRYLDYVSKYLQ